jgi:hypothetical protein
VNASAANTAIHSTETFGLPPEADRLIHKLRMMPPELLADITKADTK